MNRFDAFRRHCFHKHPVFVGGFLILTLLSGVTARAGTIDVGSHTLAPNTPNQTVQILISGVDQVQGLTFFAQIGDGGALNNGTDTKPVFSKVDILTSTIFSGNNTGATGDPNGSPAGSNAGHPLIWLDGTSTSNGSVLANGLLATLTIDTSGVSSGTYPLLLTGVANTLGTFNTSLAGAEGVTPLTITNGSITVPEPFGLGILVAIGGALACRGRAERH